MLGNRQGNMNRKYERYTGGSLTCHKSRRGRESSEVRHKIP
jgi:hypothetical protein